MNRAEICDYLRERNIWFEITEHQAAYNMEELSQVALPYPESEAKTSLSATTRSGSIT